MVNSETTTNVVIGYPLEHSKSPALHNAVYRLLNCNAVMVKHPTQDLLQTINHLRTMNTGFAAITMPYKKEIMSMLDQVSAEVECLKAVNTVIFHDNQLSGYNTDVDGIAHALRNEALQGKTVLVLGAGGAAHAAGYFLHQNHADILWLNRTQQHAVSMAILFGGKVVDVEQLNDLQIDVIINTTPLGMYPEVKTSPIPDYQFKKGQVVFDMVYNPMDTTLLVRASTQGAICISGLEMFIGQGLRQIELWLGREIDESIIEEVRKSL